MRSDVAPVERGKPGEAVAAALAGAWRSSPPAPALAAAALAQIAPLLRESGAAGLAWWRLGTSSAAASRPARPLREACRSQFLKAAQDEEAIGHVLTLLRSAGVEPLLIKGWASARLYAEPGLRPYGDLDLCIRPEQQATVRAALKGDVPAAVDLHLGVPDLPDRTWEEVWRRSQRVPLGGAAVRIPGPEDHLRLLCVHLVRHGGVRPLWLCDVGAAVEALPAGFDWDYFLSGNWQLSQWVVCIIALACRLLDARVDHPAIADAVGRLPPWVRRTVLWHWAEGRHRRPLPFYLRHPVEALRGLRYRGLNPVRMSFQLGLSPHARLPVALVQLGGWAVLIAQRLRGSIARRLSAPTGGLAVHSSMAPLALYRYSSREQPAAPEAGTSPARRRQGLLTRRTRGRAWARQLLLFLTLLFLVRSTVGDVYHVPSGSMKPALLEGDRIVVNRLAYGLRLPFLGWPLASWGSPQRGHVVVFHSPAGGKVCVKRVAGLPGDWVELPVGRLCVPPGHYFLLGDNRDRSLDSRSYGCVAQRLLIGRVGGVVLSLDPANWHLPRCPRFCCGLS